MNAGKNIFAIRGLFVVCIALSLVQSLAGADDAAEDAQTPGAGQISAAAPARLAPSEVPAASADTSGDGIAGITGEIRGITRDPKGLPLAAATVVLHASDGSSDRTCTSGADGAFALSDLKPGHYQVTAAKEGFAPSSPAPVEIASAQMFNLDLSVTGEAPSGANGGNFFRRFARAYWDDWHPSPVAGPEAPYRGYPAPVSSPPFPFSVWPIGGTVWIGYPNATSYPLTQAIYATKHGDWLKKANIQLYGWADIGMNISTSHDGTYPNAPAAYAQVANSFLLDQYTFYIERVPDTVQRDHFDWGFRLTNLYGFDYRFTTANGYFSQQLLNNPKPDGTIGNKYGYDPVMAYVDLYFPKVGQGMDVRIGRYISLPDIEAQLAPNNYTYTHSLTYTYDCYTQTGINAAIKWNDHWTTQAGLSGGCEASPWSPVAKLTGNFCLGYT